MSFDLSIVIPVKDGERYLEELLASIAAEGVARERVLVIDSGSSDRSVEIARSAGVTVEKIAPEEFGHGRTRNLGFELTDSEFVAFLTQDATPAPGWVRAYQEAFDLVDRVGAAYGPHLPRPDTSPMIARELTEFFATFSPEGAPLAHRSGDPEFLSNVNACYRRSCWEEIRFRDVAYSEDQGFGQDMLAAGWVKVYHPEAAVLHAHDYPALQFMRRYFDEYRGLRQTIGHVEQFGARSTVRDVRSLTAADRNWMKAEGFDQSDMVRWTVRSLIHHSGRKVFSALGSRASSLPAGVQRKISLEGTVVTGDSAPEASAVESRPNFPAATHQKSRISEHEYEHIARIFSDGPADLLPAIPGQGEKESLHVAFVIPPFGEGSGGHTIIYQLIQRLEKKGHTCSVWLHDPFNHTRSEWPAVLRRKANEFFAEVNAPFFKGFDSWYGADVVVATGWQTVYPVLALEQCRARAYLVNDHEPEFYSTSVESLWATETYNFDLYGITGSPWLRDLYVDKYGGQAEIYNYGVDHDIYFPRETQRRADTVVFYCRSATPRRAVALGIMALAKIARERPDLRIVFFGEHTPIDAPFPYEHVGVASPDQLSWLYSQATLGVCLSLTNYSLVPQEMLACGLPCVDLDMPCTRSIFGENGAMTLARADTDSLAGAIAGLLENEDERARQSQRGIEFVKDRDWDHGTDQVEEALRNSLRVRVRQAEESVVLS